MPDLIELSTPDWKLTVWCRDIEPARMRLRSTLLARNIPLRGQFLKPAGSAEHFLCNPTPCIQADTFELRDPVIFENRNYEFEFSFQGAVNGAEVLHHLTAIRDAFRFKEGKLRGMVNFGNDVGWFRLALRYAKEGSVREDSVSFEVLPTKLDMAGDLAGIHRIVDQEYPLWRFAFGRKTDSELSRSQRPHERFALLWLAHFAALRKELLSNARIICNSPHSRLQESCRRLPLSRLRGKPGYRLEERIAGALAENEPERLFVVKSRKLSTDTPENRFVKMVLNRCSRELGGFRRRAAEMNNSPDRERLSPRFFDELDAWRSGLDKRAAHSLFSEVGTFEGMDKESLVLQRRAGYSGVYRVWQHLKRYLDVFGNHASISLKSVSELYEIWCLLEIRRMILELGFEEKSTVKASLRLKGFEKELKDGLGASFRFFRSDGLELRLAHEPVFGKPGDKVNRIYSWTNPQKPDILLEASFPDGEKIIWIFDAKYRISGNDNGEPDEADIAPEDALNQMHRYRDALIYLTLSPDDAPLKSRPVIGAYVLFPGWFPGDLQDDPARNPYAAAIDEIGIGAFPALPGQPNKWLASFLRKHLGQRAADGYTIKAPDEHLASEPVRIAPSGLELRRSGELVFVAQSGPDRTPGYIDGFRAGTASWYHTRDQALHRAGIPGNVMNDITHCAIAVPDGNGAWRIDCVFNVISTQLCDRAEISAVQAGTGQPGSNGRYWLFRLGRAERFLDPIILENTPHFTFGIATLDELPSARNWSDVSTRYDYLYAY